MKYYPCVRCGMCCIIDACAFSDEDGSCSYLIVNDDLTTTCNNQDAVTAYVDNGIGCYFQSPDAKEVYDLHMEIYNVTKRKQELKEAQHARIHQDNAGSHTV